MGTPLENVSIVYSNLARGMYMTLDNLKLGYAGTKEGAKQLVNDAAKIDKSVKSNDISYANLVKAIHAVQEKMGVTGTTSREASKTITGSLNSVKSAWGNLLPAMVKGGDELDQCIDNFVDSVDVFAGNIMPVVEKALGGVGTLIDRLTPKIAEKIPELSQSLLPPLIKGATSLVAGLIKALPSILKVLYAEIPNIFKELGTAITSTFGEQYPIVNTFGEYFKKIGTFFKDNATAVKIFIGVLAGLPIAFKAFKGLKSVTSLFGKLKGGSNEKDGGGLFSGLTNIFKTLANTKTSTILKGMANLTIIIGGFTALVAMLAFLAPKIAKLSDGKTLVTMIGIISLLGVVGTGLTYLASIVGKIPVTTVLKGLANIGLVIAGMSALYLLIGAVSLVKFDTNRILKIVGIIGVLGAVGSALTAFAGLVGLIPIPIVLSGLANIGLVIGGMSALILAYGKLSEIKGFNNFISKGGDTLANLFKQIGKIGGSLVGGLGEGISNSLPTIGKNLNAFVTAIKPMFAQFQGVDMSGAGTFFSGLGGFLVKIAGSKLLSKLGGETNLATLGTQITDFAKNSAGFFTTVATFPENSFTNATALFKCLAGLKKLPKEGGVVQWFNGTINFNNIASGLSQLSSESVINFFNKISTLKKEAFSNGKRLFNCLASLKKLPKDGGVKGWFNGTINYDNIASGLGKLGSEKVQRFFTMAGSLNKDTFKNVEGLFKSLAGLGKLPKSGGLWDTIKSKATGKESKSKLATIADDLGNFADKTKTFFAKINNLNLGKLNGFWASLKQPSKITTNSLKIVSKNIDSMVNKSKQLPSKMGKAIISMGHLLADAITKIWNKASTASVTGANKVVKSANFVLSEIGSNKKLSYVKYANGTNGHKGGNALVNDGRGAELVQMPNGNTFIPNGRNVFLPNAPKGMKVLPAEQTAKLMGKKNATFRYADGTGDFDVWNYIDNAKGLTDHIKNSATYGGASGFALEVGKGVVSTITGQMTSFFKKQFDEMGALSLANYDASKGVEQWRTTVIRALKMEGLYSVANVKRTLYQMQTESGGNPKAINLWDSNAKKGTPSKGLMQVIDPTFKAYARAGFNKNIYDPLSNILASIRYAISRYGSLARAYQGHGYANGGLVTKTGVIAEKNKPEMVIPTASSKRKRAIGLWQQTGNILGVPNYTPENSASAYSPNNTVENNTYAPVFNLTVSGTSDDRATARKVKKWVQEAMEEVFESMERKTVKVREV